MGMVVGKKAAAPEGSAVRFDVSGDPGDARQVTLTIEGGRAKPAAGADVTPTVTLSMSAVDFVRLGCGRATAARIDSDGGVAVRGDAALGKKILESMNFMF
jgi:hypothetical protein